GLLLGLVGQDGLTLPRLLEALSQRPARIAGLEPPRLVEGAVAELVLLDPEWRWTPRHTRLETKSKNSPFMDRELKGRVAMTLAAGRIVYEAVEGVPRAACRSDADTWPFRTEPCSADASSAP